MYSQYKTLAKLANKVGGPYALSTILIKRSRQILKGKSHVLGQSGNDPMQEALDDYEKGALSIGIGDEAASHEQEDAEA